MYADYRGTISKLQQTSFVTDYQTKFEDLSTKVHGFSKQLMISFFISGLKSEIKRVLLVAQPQSLLQTMALARLQEDKFNELKQYFKCNDLYLSLLYMLIQNL